MTVSGVFKPPVTLPTAKIQVKSPKFCFPDYVMMEVGVVNTELPFDSHLLLRNGVFLSNQHIQDIIMFAGRQVDAFINESQINRCIDSNKAVDASITTLSTATSDTVVQRTRAHSLVSQGVHSEHGA